jgi:plastocyanin
MISSIPVVVVGLRCRNGEVANMFRRTRAPVWRRTVAVVAVAATLVLGGCGGGESTDDDTAGRIQDDGETLTFVGNDQLKFGEAPEQTSPGRHAVELVVEGSINHNVVFEGVAGDRPVAEADGGQTATGTVELQPGTYTYYCSVPGHRAAGMDGTLAVE